MELDERYLKTSKQDPKLLAEQEAARQAAAARATGIDPRFLKGYGSEEEEAAKAAAKTQAQLGAAGNYSPEFQQKYAELLAKGKNLDAQELLGNEMGGQFMDERNDPAYVPERIQASTVSGLATYDATDPGQAREFTAAQADAPKGVTVGPLNAVERVGTTNLGEAAGAQFERVNGAQLDTGKADQVRGAEDRYLTALEGRAAGNAPSVAENSYNSKMADVARNAMGIAGQARGSDKAYARLKAMDTIGDNTRKAAFESAQLRAGEMAQASDALGSSLSRVRGADLGQADLAAKLQQEAALSNQRTASTTSLANTDARNRRAEFGATQDLAASQANATAGNARTMDEAAMRAGVATGNVTRDQQNAQFNAGAQTGAAAANAAAANARQDTTAAAKTAEAAANAHAENQRLQLNAGQTQSAAGANQSAGLSAAQLEAQRKAGLAGNALTATGQAMSGEAAKLGAPKGPSTFDKVLGAVTTLGAGALTKSDERAKENIRDVPDDAAARLAKALDLKEFDYKQGEGDSGTHVGVMAQDLERDPLGKKLVHEDGAGMKHVDYASLTNLLLAAALRGKKEARR